MAKRRNFSVAFKAKVALEALRGVEVDQVFNDEAALAWGSWDVVRLLAVKGSAGPPPGRPTCACAHKKTRLRDWLPRAGRSVAAR